jgi:hypothetical protein
VRGLIRELRACALLAAGDGETMKATPITAKAEAPPISAKR